MDELRARTSLSALVGQTVKLTRAGREWKACCPFHHEKSPSFYVNDDKGFYHCMAGETVVVTRDGRKPIAVLAGKHVEILSRNGQWITSRFDEFGEQKLWKITLSRNGIAKEIHATSGHRWFVNDRRSEYLTTDLKPGHALQSCLPEPCKDWTLDPEGVRHGIMFGDGTMYKGIYGTLNLHGDKDAELRHWFPGQQHHVHERTNGALYLRIYGGRTFSHMKALPADTVSDGYLLGFLAGYLAADGHVAKDGTVMLNSANADTLEAIRDIATRLGLATYGRTTLLRKGYGAGVSALHRIHFVPSTLSGEIFLLKKARDRFNNHGKRFDRLRWVVKSVAPTDRFETVYCAVVPGEHAFTLDDNILTGNCFGCSAHGDVIRWMTDARGLAFVDAVKELADTAGIPLPAPDPQSSEREARASKQHDVMAAAAEWFTAQLHADVGSEARTYLAGRGIKPSTIDAFGMGFAPDRRDGIKAALARFGDAELIEAGLLISVEEKTPYDRFRGRLMIPIRDPRGRVIAFGGRILGTGEPKYLNSPDTPLFDKGRTLYNLDRAAPAARKTGRLVVVEGYLDVIALAQAGIGEAVAPLGTALTEAQLERLWRVVDVPVLCFDGDSAGRKAAVRAVERSLPLIAPGRSLSIAMLPQGQDPDDLVKSGGSAAFERVMDEAQPLVDLLWSHEMAAIPLRTPEARAGFKRRIDERVSTIVDADVRDHYRAEFRQRYDAAFFAPRTQRAQSTRRIAGKKFTFAPPIAPPGERVRSIGGGGVGSVYTRAIMVGLIRHPAMISTCAEALSMLAIDDPAIDRLRTAMLEAVFEGPVVDSERIDTISAEVGLSVLVADLRRSNGLAFSFTRGEADPLVARRDLAMAIEALASRPELDAALEAVTVRQMMGADADGYAEQQRLRMALAQADQAIAALTVDQDE
ncbi:MAG: DNA primase [Sphingomonadales bacterium]